MLSKNVNPVKDALKNNRKVSAAWLQAGSAITAEIVADAGFDVVMIDMEHGPGDILCLISQVQAMQGSCAVPFVRAPWNDMVAIKRILDAGVYGLVVPYVNTIDEVRAAAAAVMYPPEGTRGIAGSPRAAHYGDNALEYLSRANREICLFIAVETPQALANLDAILQVDRLDGVFIGPMDLATGMGHFANPAAEPVRKAIAVIEEKVKASGKALATVAGSWDDAAAKYKRGYSMIVSMSDTVSLGKLARETVASFKKEFDHV